MSELLPASVDLTDSIVFSTGCHAGYNLVDGDSIAGVTQSTDWAQVLARKGATLVAGTGFQYGDDELIEYSERVYAEFAHQLRVGTGSVSVGQALVQSKLAYLAATPQIQGMHEKALLTASVFGLPMFSVNMPGTRDTTAAAGSPITTNDGLGVSSSDLHLTNTQFAVPATPTAGPDGTTYFSGRQRCRIQPGRAGPAALRGQRRREDQGPPGHRVPGRGRSPRRPASSRTSGRRAPNSVGRRPRSLRRPSIRPGCGPPATSPTSAAAPRTSW